MTDIKTVKLLSLSDFQALVARTDWVRTQDLDVVEYMTRQEEAWDEEHDEPILRDIPHALGVANRYSTLDGITISYSESFNFDENEPSTLTHSVDGMDIVWSIEGMMVVDEDGEKIGADELSYYLSSDFKEIDYDGLVTVSVTDIDYDKDCKMETFELAVDNAPSIRFSGELLATAKSNANNASGTRYSGQTGRWTTLALYKTAGGKYICHQIGHTNWIGERDRYTAAVCDSLDGVREFFGHRWLAKELYADAGIDDSVTVE